MRPPASKPSRWRTNGQFHIACCVILTANVIGPDGKWVTGPAYGKDEIVYGEIDLRATVEAKLLLDSTGHYNRPDVFNLTIDDRPKPAVGWMSGGAKWRTGGGDESSGSSEAEAPE